MLADWFDVVALVMLSGGCSKCMGRSYEDVRTELFVRFDLQSLIVQYRVESGSIRMRVHPTLRDRQALEGLRLSSAVHRADQVHLGTQHSIHMHHR